MTVIGASLLWFGWFGFNAGSALGANGLAANALVVTNTAAAAATLSWVFTEWMHHGKPTILGAASGCVAGLVAITPACGFVSVVPCCDWLSSRNHLLPCSEYVKSQNWLR